MFDHSLDSKLAQLRKDGHLLLKRSSEQDNEVFPVNVWLAATNDLLKLTLPEESALLDEFKKIRGPETENYTRKQLEEIVTKVTHILEYAQLRLPEFYHSEAYSKFKEAERERLDHEIYNIINKRYFNSWWFRLPIALLALAVIFAITGAIQIQGYALSVQDITDKAIERAKQDINAQTEVIISDLRAHTEAEKNRITGAANNQIESLKQEKAPDADKALSEITAKIDNLDSRLKPLEGNIDNLEDRVVPLERALEAISQDNKRGLLDDASIVLKNSIIVVWASIVISSLVLILSLLALWRAGKQK